MEWGYGGRGDKMPVASYKFGKVSIFGFNLFVLYREKLGEDRTFWTWFATMLLMRILQNGVGVVT